MQYLINKLPRSMKEELFNLHATFNNPDANERLFYLTTVPVKTIDLNSINKDVLYPMSDEQCDEYMTLVKNKPEYSFGTVSEGKLMDGVHRITSRIRNDLDTMYVLDMTGLINPHIHMAGHVCDVEFTDRPVVNCKPEDGIDLSLSR